MVWKCSAARQLQRQDIETGATGQQEVERKTKKEIYGCGERGHEVNWCEARGCRGQEQMETDDSLWRPLKENSKREEDDDEWS